LPKTSKLSSFCSFRNGIFVWLFCFKPKCIVYHYATTYEQPDFSRILSFKFWHLKSNFYLDSLPLQSKVEEAKNVWFVDNVDKNIYVHDLTSIPAQHQPTASSAFSCISPT
jgi:hypothetical protein